LKHQNVKIFILKKRIVAFSEKIRTSRFIKDKTVDLNQKG